MKMHYEKSPNIATQGIALKAFQIQRVHFSLPGFPLKLILKVSWIGLVNPENKSVSLLNETQLVQWA